MIIEFFHDQTKVSKSMAQPTSSIKSLLHNSTYSKAAIMLMEYHWRCMHFYMKMRLPYSDE